MKGFVIMIICCTALAALSQKRNDSIRRNHGKSKERLLFYTLTCYMIIFAGLRVSFNDTYGYILGFNSMTGFPAILKELDWSLGNNPGFKIYSAIIKTFFQNSSIFLMISSVITYATIMWFLRKYSKNLMLSTLVMFAIGYYAFGMAAVKQILATSFSLIAVDKLIEKKKIQFVVLVFVGMTFHPYCLLYLLSPILSKQQPWKMGTFFLLLAAAVMAYSFNYLPGLIVSFTETLGDDYNADAFIGEGVNVFRVMVYFVPVLISFIWRKKFFTTSTRVDNLFVNLSILSAMVMFVGLFGDPNMFARLAKFFDPMVCLSLPWMIYKLRDTMMSFVLSIGCYTAFPLFFLYQNVLSASFDAEYSSISIGQFINLLLQ